MTDEARNKFNKINDGINIESKIKTLQKRYEIVNLSLKLLDEKMDINDRSLTTDNFFIILGHSFDAVRENNKVYKQFHISSTHQKSN
jgi:hypothetical protein